MRVPAAALLLLTAGLAGCLGPTPAPPPEPSRDGPGTATPPVMPSPVPSPLPAAAAGALPRVRLNTSLGLIYIELFADTPVTAHNFLNLTRAGFYDGTRFHRVVKDLLIQGGDPLSKDPNQADAWGTGGPNDTLPDEFPCADGSVSYALPPACPDGAAHRFTEDGLLAMANAGSPHSGGSQFFLTLSRPSELDGRNVIFGKTVGGLDVARAIGQVPTKRPPQGGEASRPVVDVMLHDARIEG